MERSEPETCYEPVACMVCGGDVVRVASANRTAGWACESCGSFHSFEGVQSLGGGEHVNERSPLDEL